MVLETRPGAAGQQTPACQDVKATLISQTSQVSGRIGKRIDTGVVVVGWHFELQPKVSTWAWCEEVQAVTGLAGSIGSWKDVQCALVEVRGCSCVADVDGFLAHVCSPMLPLRERCSRRIYS